MKEYLPDIIIAFFTVIVFVLIRKLLWEKIKDNYGSTLECTPITGMIGWGLAYQNGKPDEPIYVYEKGTPLAFDRSVSNTGYLPVAYRYYYHLNSFESVEIGDFYYHPSEIGDAEKVKYHYLHTAINGSNSSGDLRLIKRSAYENDGTIIITNKRDLSIISKGLNRDYLLIDFNNYGLYDFDIVLEYTRRNEIKTIVNKIRVLFLDTDMDRLRDDSFRKLNNEFSEVK